MNRQVENITGVITRTVTRINDQRGWFSPALNQDDTNIQSSWILQNISLSKPKVLRGLHYQTNHPQTKIITLISGEIQDIVADLRPDSPTYNQFAVYNLNYKNINQIYIPKGCAHGFLVTSSEDALITYLTDAPYDPTSEQTLPWNHPDWNFPWKTKENIISEKDK